MPSTFQIPKETGTYADTLEAYGLADLVSKILINVSHRVTVNDQGGYYEVKANKMISREVIDQLSYFQVIKFIKKDDSHKPPEDRVSNFYDYPLQRELRKRKRKEIEEAGKALKGDDFKQKRKLIHQKYQSEAVEQPLLAEYDVLAQLISNPYAAYSKLYSNFSDNQSHFKELIIEILNQYVLPEDQFASAYQELLKTKQVNIDEKATMLQLLNPDQGKGLNKSKATGMSVGNLKGNWIKETLKVSGALHFGMICQSVKVGGSYDLKVFVPAFHNITEDKRKTLLEKFKRNLKSNSPIKLDILNTLQILSIFIENNADYRGKIKDTLLGLHTVYQKDLGQNKAVVNIGFLEIPYFIELAGEDGFRGNDWLEIIKDQQRLIGGITELGDTLIGLMAYRNFLNGSSIEDYFKFQFWYATYLMHELSNNKQTYVTSNKVETLNKIFILMDISFKEIIENEGFKSIAAAIRKSTISLQYTPKAQRKYDVQYGLAQKLQIKAKSKDELVAYISEFIAKYNSDTARQYEKTHQAFRANVRDEELQQFFELADQVESKVLGAMLAAYGFALNKKDKSEE